MSLEVLDKEAEFVEEELDVPSSLTFEDKLKTWDMSKVIRVKDPKAHAYVLDKIFWENPLHHKSKEFYQKVIGFIKTSIRKYGCEEQYYDEDLPIQVYNKILEAIDSYYRPEEANVVTFLHKVLFNHIKLRAYHANKYKDGTFYNRFYTYDKIIKSITRNLTTNDLITLNNYFDHLKYVKFNNKFSNYLKNDLVKIAPRNNIFFKAIMWELFQGDEHATIGRLSSKFDNGTDPESIQRRRSIIRRH